MRHCIIERYECHRTGDVAYLIYHANADGEHTRPIGVLKCEPPVWFEKNETGDGEVYTDCFVTIDEFTYLVIPTDPSLWKTFAVSEGGMRQITQHATVLRGVVEPVTAAIPSPPSES